MTKLYWQPGGLYLEIVSNIVNGTFSNFQNVEFGCIIKSVWNIMYLNNVNIWFT